MAVVLIPLVGMAGYFALLVFKMRYPPAVPEDATPSHYLLPAQEVSWEGVAGRAEPGWWIPGTAGHPAVLLAPGYELSRSDGLSLAAELSRSGFHSLVFSAGGRSGKNVERPVYYGEPAILNLLAALDFLRSQPGVDRSRVGIWGVDIGAWAALTAACRRSEVVSIVADSPFDTAGDFIRIRIKAYLGYTNPWIERLFHGALGLAEHVDAASLVARLPLDGLAGRRVLLIQGRNRPDLMPWAESIHARGQPQMELAVMDSSRVRLMDTATMAVYDRKVADYLSAGLDSAGLVQSGADAGRNRNNRE